MVCLDFDGVILESAIVKKDAYRKLFEVFVDHREQIEAYQAENGGLPRRRQFVEIFDQIMGQPLKAEQVDDLERRYVGQCRCLPQRHPDHDDPQRRGSYRHAG